MKRTKQTPLAILTGDWHLRETTPRCRTDDFMQAQTNKLVFIQSLQQTHGCPVIHSGDLFNQWKPLPSPWLLSYALEFLPEQFWTIYGNHDLPEHSLKLSERSGIRTLEQAGRLTVLSGIHWGQSEDHYHTLNFGTLAMIVHHIMTYAGTPPWPGCTDPEAGDMLKDVGKRRAVDLILTGHNHQAFVVEKNGRLLVNPGSLTRQKADQVDFRPRVYLWYPDNTVEAVYLPIEEGVVSREHLAKAEEQKSRAEAFIARLKQDEAVSLSFRENLERHFAMNETSPSVEELIWSVYPGGD